MTFQSDAKEAANKYFSVRSEGKNMLGNDTYSADHPGCLVNNAERRPAFLAGYEAGARRMIEELRSMDCILEFGDTDCSMNSVADYLERILEEK